MAAQRSIKAANTLWIWSVVAVDALVCVLVAEPAIVTDFQLSKALALRALVIGAAPVLVLMLTSLLSADAKAVLVYWRLSEVLPGHRAFSVHAPKDTRIDLKRLRKHVGPFPDNANEQDKLWFRLYSMVGTEITVVEPHKLYLLFRDIAALSLILIPVALLAMWLSESINIGKAAAVVTLFAIQYLASALAARNNGFRLITSVLSLHSVKKRTASERRPPAKKRTKGT